MIYCIRSFIIGFLYFGVLSVVFLLAYIVDAEGISGIGKVVVINNRSNIPLLKSSTAIDNGGEADLRVTWAYNKLLDSGFERGNLKHEDIRRNSTEIIGEERVSPGRERVYHIPVGAELTIYTDYFEEDGSSGTRPRSPSRGFTPLLLDKNICKFRAQRYVQTIVFSQEGVTLTEGASVDYTKSKYGSLDVSVSPPNKSKRCCSIQ